MVTKQKAAVVSTAIILAAASATYAAAIAPNDILVYQVASSGFGIGNNSANLSIVDLPTGQLLTPVQIFDISAMASPLYSTTVHPIANMALSANGTEVSFTGWTTTGSGGPLGSQAIPRGVGVLNAAGVYSLVATYTPGSLLPGGIDQPHAAYASDGVNWYIGATTGMYLNGGTTPLTHSDGTLAVKGFGGVTYALHTIPNPALDVDGTASATVLSTVTPATPAPGTTSITYSPVVTLPASARDFSMLSSQNNGVFDTLYLTTASGISKFGLVNGTWTPEGADTLVGVESIVALPRPAGGANLFVTVEPIAGGDTVDAIEDNASFNATLSASTPFIRYTAPVNGALRGLSAAPIPEPATFVLLASSFALLALKSPRRSA
jgi:hypothetical protein